MAAAVPLLIQVGIAAGTYAASSMLAPKPKLRPVDKGRFDDIRFQTAEEGAFKPLCFGKRVRLAGNMIWGTVTREYVSRTEGRTGGKGGGGGQQPTPPTETFTYKKSFAILVCSTPVKSYRRISENLEAIYNNVGSELREDFYEAEHHTLAGGASVVADGECSGGRAARLAGSGQYVEFNVSALAAGLYSVVIFYKAAGSASVHLSANGGAETAVSLPATSAVPLTVTATLMLRRGANTVRLRRNTGTTDVDRIYLSETGGLPAPPPGEPPEWPIGPRLPQREATNLIDEAGSYPTNPDNPVPFYNAVQGFDANSYFEGHTTAGGQARFELFAGKETQPQSAIIVAVEGAAETPAWRDDSYFVTEDYLVKDGQLGNFIFEIEPEIQNLDEALLYLYTLDGKVTAADCDFSALSGITIPGMVLDHRAPLEEWVAALETWFNFDIVPRGGKIAAVKRGGAVVTRLYERELRAHLFGEERPRAAVKVAHEDPVDLPGAVDVVYLDPSPSKDFHAGNQTAQKIVGFAFDYETLTFPLVGDPDTAQAVGMRYLDARHLAAKPAEMVCGFGKRHLIPTDIAEVELEDGTLYTYRITQKQADLQGLVKFGVVPERPSIYGQGGAGFSGRGGDVLVIRGFANTLLVIIDSVPLRQDDVGGLVLYSAACPRGPGLWPGYHLNKKDRNGESERIAGFTDAATIGVVETASNSTARTGYEPSRSFVVKLYSGSLESRTYDETRAARVNLALYGNSSRWEVLQFTSVTPQTATPPFVAQYLVTGVFTGILGSEHNAGAHQANDFFVLVDAAVKSFPVPAIDATQQLTFIGQTAGQALSDAEAVGSFTLTFQGNSRKPLAPSRIEIDPDTGRAPRDSQGSILVTAWPRTNADLVGDEYLIELLTDDRLTVKHQMPLREGVATAALFEATGGGKYGSAAANTVSSGISIEGSPTAPRIGRSLQRVVAPGNYVEGTLFLTGLDDLACLGLVGEGLEWRTLGVPAGGDTYGADYMIRMSYAGSGSVYNVRISVAGVTVKTQAVTAPNNLIRARILLSGTEVRFYVMEAAGLPSAYPVYVSPVAPRFPLRAYARVEKGTAEITEVRHVVVSTDPLPTTIISAAQQQLYYGGLKNPLQVRIAQYSGVREIGYGPPWEGAI